MKGSPAMPDLEDFMFGDIATAIDASNVRPPIDYDPITPTPIALMDVGPEPPQPICRPLGCPHVDACIFEGFCDHEYMLYHERPHIWQGDYS